MPNDLVISLSNVQLIAKIDIWALYMGIYGLIMPIYTSNLHTGYRSSPLGSLF